MIALPRPHFVVVDENILGYIYVEQPEYVNILASSIIRGACVTWRDGFTVLPYDATRIRVATVEDFQTFMVMPPTEYFPKPADRRELRGFTL